MTLKLASLNVRRLRDPSKYACLFGELLNSCVDITVVQKTHFTCTENFQVLEDDIVILSAFSNRCSTEVSRLFGHSLNSIVNLVFADDRGRFVVAAIAIKCFAFRIVAFYVPNSVGERRFFFR